MALINPIHSIQHPTTNSVKMYINWRQQKAEHYLSRINLSTSKKLNSRINIKKTSRINKWASVSFQFTVISFTSKKPTNLFTFYKFSTP